MGELSEKEYRRLKQDVDEAKSEADKAKGALEQLMSQLKSEFDCDDLKSAKELLQKLEEKRDKAQREFQKEMIAYEKKWKTE